jgi:hypothetical protein
MGGECNPFSAGAGGAKKSTGGGGSVQEPTIPHAPF